MGPSFCHKLVVCGTHAPNDYRLESYACMNCTHSFFLAAASLSAAWEICTFVLRAGFDVTSRHVVSQSGYCGRGKMRLCLLLSAIGQQRRMYTIALGALGESPTCALNLLSLLSLFTASIVTVLAIVAGFSHELSPFYFQRRRSGGVLPFSIRRNRIFLNRSSIRRSLHARSQSG